MRQTYLHSGWVLENITEKPSYVRSAVQYQGPLPATVPGHVHLDLVANGVISDPFFRLAELGCRWVDESDWSYKTVFEWYEDEALPNRVLKFEGLDTVCQVLLNGQVIGEFDNMFVPVEIDVTPKLIDGTNQLEVRFFSPVRVGDERRSKYFAEEGLSMDCAQFDERAFVRKAQYMSAWDWGPRLASCGIWQPVSLVEFASRIKSFTVFQERLQDGSFHVRSETIVEGTGKLSLSFGDYRVESEVGSISEIDTIIRSPALWWPNGLGSQHLYSSRAELEGANSIEKRIGLRTVSLERKPDEVGETFTFFVNGEKLWARGANWIPNDSFPSQVSLRDYQNQVLTCKSLGMNMLRVWGGGLYELDGFYDACDEAGILVWQDFMYACSYYADGDEACKVARDEAKVQIRRLRDRTSLALWCANNENLTMWQGKWGGAESPPRYYGERIYDEVLPALIEELDPSRSYIPTSPIGQSPDKADCNQGKYGDSHYWAVWHGLGDWVYYKDSDTRFSSEFGFASSCSLALWHKAIAGEDWRMDSPVVRWHDKTGKDWDKFFGYVTTHYPEPESLEDWTYYSQLNQRDALRFGIEHWRRSEDCQGTLIWQFNDCWPVQSWAVQDYMRLLKPAGFELKRLYADRLVSLYREDSELSTYLINDGSTSWSANLLFEVFSTIDGVLLQHETLVAEVQPNSRFLLDRQNTSAYTNALIRVSDETGAATFALVAEPKDTEFAAPEFFVDISEEGLEIGVRGIAIDLVVTDPDDPYNLTPKGTALAGMASQTLINERAYFDYKVKPTQLAVQSLYGRHLIAL